MYSAFTTSPITRELKNIIERAAFLLADEYVTKIELTATINQSCVDKSLGDSAATGHANRPLEEIEKEAILAPLKASAGNKSESMRRFVINRKILNKKLQDYVID